MKTTFTTQHNAASTLNGSHAAHNVYSPLRRLTLLVTLLMSFALGARAQNYYVFMNGRGSYICNNNGTLTAVSEFSPSCVWIANNVLGSTSRTLQSFVNNTQYLSASEDNVTISNSSQERWRISNSFLYNYYEGFIFWGGYTSYINHNGNQFSTSTSSNNNNGFKAISITVNKTASTEKHTYSTPEISITPTTGNINYPGSQSYEASATKIERTTTGRIGYTTFTVNSITHIYDDNNNKLNSTPSNTTTKKEYVVQSYTWQALGNASDYISGSSNSSSITYTTTSEPANDVQGTITVKANYTDENDLTSVNIPSATAVIKITLIKDDPTGITAEPLMLEVGGTGSITYRLKPTGAKDEITYNGYDNTIISIDANGVVTGLKAGITEVTLTAKKLDNSDGPSAKVQVTVTPKAPTIEFSLGSGIIATITNPGANGTIYYTTNGDTPTANSTPYTDPFTVEAGVTVKAIVVVTVNDVQLVSPVTESLAIAGSDIIGKTVFLYDLEDHNWTYYSGVNTSVDGGNYNTQYAGKLYSPNPRNVKITYNANGGAVSIDESETSFVYFKTLEQGATAEYPYTVISNPFSKRPTGKGFGGWKIISGHQYIRRADGDMAAEKATLNLDEEITFVNLPYPSTNCISAEIELEATWVDLNNITRSSGNNITYSVNGGTYETNILVLNGNTSATIAPGCSVTIMMVEPDGSKDYRTNTFTGGITPNNGGVTKIEFAHWKPGAAVDARGRNLTIGRGMNMDGTSRALYGTNQSETMNQILKVESGKFASFISYNNVPSSITKHHAILGCDYDRADKNDENLTITGEMRLMKSSVSRINSTAGKELAIITAKSGTFTSELTHTSAKESANCFYLWDASSSNTQVGYRKLEIEGGIFWNIGGGMDKSNSTDRITLEMRIKGGTIKGAIFGGGATYDAHGHRLFVCTGGKIGGWIAPGANGIVTSGTSLLDGKSFVYIGGRTRVDSQYADYEKIDNSTGGNVFGAGCGYSSESTRGRVEQGTNVVIADEAYVQRGVYGGGAYGYCEESETANIYITGGHIGSEYDDQFDVYGGVYGGARQNRGGTVNIYMTGGQIDGQKQGGTSGGGVYGGSNVTGTISGNVTMQINGGQVGTTSQTANIHGGGYGQATRVSGDVEVTLGTEKQTTGGVTVYGDVYGGSALGYVNGTTATNTYHTHVTMNKGTIYGSLYGGALGSNTVPANVYGPVEVKVYGGSVKKVGDNDGSGGVYGANNINGAPQRSVTVDIYGTDPAPAENQYALHAVYGGGNQASYNGTPIVTVHNCDNSIEYVYGGGNAAAVAATDVTIWGGDVIGNVFGGGNGTVKAANVTGNTSTKIYGGIILNVYGGSNSQGTIGRDISVLVDSQGEGEKEPCPMNIGSVYGGGNLAASKSGNISINCTGEKGYIENVFGGANQANITSDINLRIDGGNIGNVFGGNNNSGIIDGTITVTVGNAPNHCGVFRIGNVYGGGNLAAYSAPTESQNFPMVNIKGGTVLNAVYGGGLGESAVVTGNPRVNVSGGTVGNKTTLVGATMITGDVFGGGSQAPLKGNAIVTLSDNANVYNCVYGGGLGESAIVTGNPQVTMTGGTVGYTETVDGKQVVRGGDVFGGGNAAAVQGNTSVTITNGTVMHNVYGGGNQAKVTGKTNVVIGQ